MIFKMAILFFIIFNLSAKEKVENKYLNFINKSTEEIIPIQDCLGLCEAISFLSRTYINNCFDSNINFKKVKHSLVHGLFDVKKIGYDTKYTLDDRYSDKLNNENNSCLILEEFVGKDNSIISRYDCSSSCQK